MMQNIQNLQQLHSWSNSIHEATNKTNYQVE